jgi:hypothetical protein
MEIVTKKMKNSIDSFISVDQRPASSQLKSLTSNVDDTICDLEEITLKRYESIPGFETIMEKIAEESLKQEENKITE